MAVGTRQQESKYKRAFGTNQTLASSKKSTPPPGFSKFRFAYCILPTSFPWRFGAKNFVEVVLLNILSVRI